MRVASFIEDPARDIGERPILSPTLGEEFDSVFIQVTLPTYLSDNFQEWLKLNIFTRIHPKNHAGVRIAIVSANYN